MHKVTRAALAAVAGLLLLLPAFADELIPPPVVPSYELTALFGSKAECISIATVTRNMLIDKRWVGGRVLALSKGADTGFANEWRRVSHASSVKVKGVLVHLFAMGPGSLDVTVDVVEFSELGCAISRTFIAGTAWISIWHGVVANAARTAAGDRDI